MKNKLIVFGFILLATALIGLLVQRQFFGRSTSQDSPEANSPLCGPISLWIAAQRLGVPVSLQQLGREFKESSSGTSFGELQRAAERAGLIATLGRVEWNELIKHDGTAILLINGNHFVTVDCREKDAEVLPDIERIRLYDANDFARWFDRDKLLKVWDGPALLLSSSVFTDRPSQEPRLASPFFYSDVGLIRNSNATTFNIPISNVGGEPLTVKVKGTSCGCGLAKLREEVIEPGAASELEVIIDLNRVSRRFSANVLVETNDPRNQALVFTVSGAAYREQILSSQSVEFGRLQPGKSETLRLAVYDPGNGDLEIGDLVIEKRKHVGDQSDTSIQPSFRLRAIAFNEVDEEVQKQLQLSRNDYVIEVTADAPATCLPGLFAMDLKIGTKLPDHPDVKVELIGSVMPDLISKPAALVSVLKRNQSEMLWDLEIKSLAKNSLVGLELKADTDFPVKIVRQVMLNDGVRFSISVTLPSDRNDKHFESLLRFQTPAGQFIEVPVLLSQDTAG